MSEVSSTPRYVPATDFPYGLFREQVNWASRDLGYRTHRDKQSGGRPDRRFRQSHSDARVAALSYDSDDVIAGLSVIQTRVRGMWA